MTKTKNAEIQLQRNGYSIEWECSLRGRKIVKATKDGKDTKYFSNVMKLWDSLNV